jgi:hypothetical protein
MDHCSGRHTTPSKPVFWSRLRVGLLILLTCTSQICQAQDLETEFGTQNSTFYHLLHPNKSEFDLGFLYEPGHKEDGGAGEFDLQNYFFNADLLAPQSQDSFLNFGLNYQLRSYSFKPVNSPTEVSSLDLHAIPFTLGYGIFLTEDLLLQGQGTLGIYSDFADFPREEEFQIHAKGLMAYRINPFTQLLLGAFRSNDFDSSGFIPLVGFRLQSGGGRLHISVTLPQEAVVSYFISPHTSLYGKGTISGDEYSAIVGQQDLRIDVRHQDRRLGFGATHWFNEHFNIGLEAGLNAKAEFEFQRFNAGQFREKTDNAYYGVARLGFAL